MYIQLPTSMNNHRSMEEVIYQQYKLQYRCCSHLQVPPLSMTKPNPKSSESWKITTRQVKPPYQVYMEFLIAFSRHAKMIYGLSGQAGHEAKTKCNHL